jgi:hypothetical protein
MAHLTRTGNRMSTTRVGGIEDMLSLSRLLWIVAILSGLCALVARFIRLPLLLTIRPDTWLEATGVLLLFCIATALLGIADQMVRKAS